MITVQSIGGYATIQDLGRPGYMKFGIPHSGSMDLVSSNQANQLLENALNTPVIELFGGEMVLYCECSALFSVTGAEVTVETEMGVYTSPCKVYVDTGQKLKIGRVNNGNIVYLGIKGGIDTQMSFDSASTYLPANYGGNTGNPLRAGDQVIPNKSTFPAQDNLCFPRKVYYPNSLKIRVLQGPEFDLLNTESKQILFTESFEIGETNRMGYRLKGNHLSAQAEKLTSRVVLKGVIQLPPDGQPIILLSDAQTTGGYPRILQVSEEDLNYLVQMGRGDRVRFLIG